MSEREAILAGDFNIESLLSRPEVNFLHYPQVVNPGVELAKSSVAHTSPSTAAVFCQRSLTVGAKSNARCSRLDCGNDAETRRRGRALSQIFL